MNRAFVIVFGVLLLCISCSEQDSNSTASPALDYWQFTINDSTQLNIEIEDNGANPIVINDEERITLIQSGTKNQWNVYRFPVFNSFIFLDSIDKSKGFYVDSSRKVPYSFHFEKRSEPMINSNEKSEHWKFKMTFSPRTNDEFIGLGDFHISGQKITGTIRTETGDFRALSGKIQNGRFNVGTLDGSHVYTFQGEINRKEISGRFYSGSHWSTDFSGKRDDSFQLTHADSLTKVVMEEKFDFHLLSDQGDSIRFSERYKDKVTIVQILGSWCPNCMDETRYYLELRKKFPELAIVGVAFERSEFPELATKSLNRMRKDLGVDYELVIGGISNKSKASELFPMLNQIISFPTSVFIDKQGEIRKVHTGFNGPATGEVYLDYVRETEAFVSQLLKE